MGIITNALQRTPIRPGRKHYIEVDFEKAIDFQLETIPKISVSKIKYSDGVVFVESQARVVMEMKVHSDGTIGNFKATFSQAMYNAIELFGSLTLDKDILIITDSYYAYIKGYIVEMLYDNISIIYKRAKENHITARNFYKNYKDSLNPLLQDIKSVSTIGTDFTSEEFLHMIDSSYKL